MSRILVCALLMLLPMLAPAQKTWQPVSQDITFKIKNAGLTVNGSFDGWRTELKFSPDKLGTSHLKATVEVNTIKTGIGLRDKHLKSDKYFDADSFKTITVESNKLYIKGTDYAGMFSVTIKGVTKEIEIPFQFNQFADEAEFKGHFPLNRLDFGVGSKSMTMADELEVNIVIKAKS